MNEKCLYENVADEFPIGLWRADSDGNLVYFNKKLKKYFGKSAMGSHFSTLIPIEDERESFLETWDRSGSTVFEFHDATASKWYRLQVHRVENCYIGITNNITSEKTLIPQLLSFKSEKIVF